MRQILLDDHFRPYQLLAVFEITRMALENEEVKEKAKTALEMDDDDLEELSGAVVSFMETICTTPQDVEVTQAGRAALDRKAQGHETTV